jgi:thymidylate synthase
MSNIEKQYQGILRKLVLYGKEKGDRTGTGTLSYFGDQIRHNMADGFPLLTTKKMAVKTMMTELKWFLKGDTNIKYLVDNNCHIWDGDAYKAFKSTFSPMPGIQSSLPSQNEFINKIKTDDEFAQKWGELGPIYGKQWRSWKGDTWVEGNTDGTEGFYLQSETIDQIQNLINDLKTNPDSRRLMVSAWNVGEVEEVVLPPCHYGFQCYVQDGKLSLMWNQRSCDTFLGIPFNIASYATLLLLLCKETGLEAGELIGNLGDVHLYKNHIQQAKEQIVREPFPLPTIELSNVDILNGEWDYSIIDYEYHPTIKAPLSN